MPLGASGLSGRFLGNWKPAERFWELLGLSNPSRNLWEHSGTLLGAVWNFSRQPFREPLGASLGPSGAFWRLLLGA